MTITVDFGQLHPAAHETWTAIARMVASTNTQTWAVVGGQMVAIHATVRGVELPRATDDGDIVVMSARSPATRDETSPMSWWPTASNQNSRRRESSDS